MSRTLLLCAVLAIGSFKSVAAQEAPVSPGDRVRVWTAIDARGNPVGRPTVGTLSLWTADSVVVDTGKNGGVTIPRSMVTRVDQSLGRRSRGRSALRGAGFGLLIGGVGGAFSGLISGDDEPGWFAFTAEEKALIGGIAFGGMGTVLGGVIGALAPTDQWEQISLPARLGVTPSQRGFTFSASFQF